MATSAVRTFLQPWADLATQSGGTCLSIFLPTGGQSARDCDAGIRRLLGAAAEKMGMLGVAEMRAQRLLAAARGLLSDRTLWRQAGEGIAVFCGPGTARSLRVPMPLREEVVVAERFHLDPLRVNRPAVRRRHGQDRSGASVRPAA
jgi:hypothetical protein